MSNSGNCESDLKESKLFGLLFPIPSSLGPIDFWNYFMSICLKSEIFRSVGVEAGVPAVGEGAPWGDLPGTRAAAPGSRSVCRQCANCPVAFIARALNAKFCLSSLYSGKSGMALWNKTCPVPL